MIQARKLCHSVRLLNPILLAFAIDLSWATSMYVVYSPNKIGTLCGFVSTRSFRQVWQTSIVFCSIIGGQSASFFCPEIVVEYPFSQASLPFIHSTNFDFRAWITSSVILLSSPLSLHSIIRRCILYFFSPKKIFCGYEIDISIR